MTIFGPTIAGFGKRGGIWSPLSYGVGSLWLDSSDATTITIATGVAAWNDKGDIAADLEELTLAKQPTRTASDSTFDGNSSIYFNAAYAQRMTSVNNLTFHKMSTFWVIAPDTLTRLYTFGNGTYPFQTAYLSGSTHGAVFDAAGLFDIITISSFGAADGTARIIEHSWDGTSASHKLYLNGVDITVSTYYTSNPSAVPVTGQLRIAQYQDGTESITAKYSEICGVVGRVATASERTKQYTYFAAKYPSIGITIP